MSEVREGVRGQGMCQRSGNVSEVAHADIGHRHPSELCGLCKLAISCLWGLLAFWIKLTPGEALRILATTLLEAF